MRKGLPRERQYGSACRWALNVCWEASDYLWSQRLQPLLPDLVLILRRYGQLTCSKEAEWLLTEAGISTVERTMRELHRVAVDRLMSCTKPGGLPVWVNMVRDRSSA